MFIRWRSGKNTRNRLGFLFPPAFPELTSTGVRASVSATKYNVELRDKDGYLKTYLTPFCKSVSWEWNRIGGCGNCRIKLYMEYRKLDFNAGDDIQIRLKSGSTSKLVYRGWVIGVIPSLKESQEISLEVRGYFEKLKYIIVQDSGDTKTYSDTSVLSIINDIVDTYVTPNSSISKGTVEGAIFSVDTLEFKTKVSEALETLAELEGKVEYGVDENLNFFWYKQSDTLSHKFIVGYDVTSFERRVNWSNLLNKIYFEGGEVNDAPYLKTVENGDSQDMYYLAEGIVTNSSIVTSSVADQYLSSALKEKAAPELILKAKIHNKNLRFEDTVPLGEVAIYDPDYDESSYIVGESGDGGSDLTIGLLADGGSNATIGGTFQDQIDKISYSLSDTDEYVNIDLTLGGTILETSAKIKQIEHLLSNIRQRG